MKKIVFLELSIKNFLSVGNEEVVIQFENGLNIIRGINYDEEGIANGVGKSAIGDALHFAIFGTTVRDLKKNLIVNRKNGKNCVVILKYKVNSDLYVVKRTIATASLTLTINGVDETRSSVAETTKAIIDSLSVNEEIFENCILMRANDTIPFMHKKPSERKAFIESIFSFSILSDMLKAVRADNNLAKKNYDIATTKKMTIENSLNSFMKQMAEMKERKVRKDAEREANRKNTKKAIEEETRKIEENQLILKKEQPDTSKDEALFKSGKNLHETLMTEIYKLNGQIGGIDRDIDKIEKSGIACPFCHREYGEEQQKGAIQEKETLLKQKSDILEAISEKTKKRDRVKEKLEELSAKLKEGSDARLEARLATERIKTAKWNIEALERRLNESEEDDGYYIQSFEKNIAEQTEKLEESKREIVEINAEKAKFSACEIILGEEGVRKYIVNKLLAILNERIGYYLRSFKSMFEFTFDEVFEEEIKDSLGIVCSYHNCSGAEAKKIDLAISFAFLDILKIQEQTEYNLTIFDEILDSSIDTKSLDLIVKFIGEQTKKNGKATYFITHKTDVKFPDVNKVILLEKRNGFTKMGG